LEKSNSTKALKDEENRWVVVTASLLLAIGTVVCFASGGSTAFRVWISPGTTNCSVSELGHVHQDGYAKFSCTGGFVNTSEEVTLFLTGGIGPVKHMQVFRMAPIYESPASKVTVALAVANNEHIKEKPCNDGLCGLTLSLSSPQGGTPCRAFRCASTTKEQGSLEKLAKLVTDKVMHNTPGQVDLTSLPAVSLTDPSNPFGQVKQAILAFSCFFVTLCGLVWQQIDACFDERNRRRLSDNEYLMRNSTGNDYLMQPVAASARFRASAIRSPGISGDERRSLLVDNAAGETGLRQSTRLSVVTFSPSCSRTDSL
jgi:hypothetical protein